MSVATKIILKIILIFEYFPKASFSTFDCLIMHWKSWGQQGVTDILLQFLEKNWRITIIWGYENNNVNILQTAVAGKCLNICQL